MKYMVVTVQYIDTVELNIVSSNLHDSVTIQVVYKLLLVSYMLISWQPVIILVHAHRNWEEWGTLNFVSSQSL